MTILFLKVLQPQVQIRTHRMYTALLASGIFCLYMDAYSLLVLMNAGGEYGLYVRVVCKLYLVALDAMCCLSFLYLSTDLTLHNRLLRFVRGGFCVWGSVMGVVICLLPIYVNDTTEQIFTYGASVYATYLVAASTLLANLVMMLSYRKDMERRKWLAGMMWVLIWIIATVIQLTHADLLLIGYAAAVGITIVFIQLETPDYQKLNETLRQLEISRKEASEASKAKSSFLAQMSHEIRTPINAVLGMNEMILRESKEENILEYASNAYNSGKALLSLINDVLDISKIEAGKLEIVEAEYGLSSLVNDCYRMVEDRAKKKNLQLTYSVEESMPSRLIGDMFHIRQVVVNFLTNAVKYTEKGSVELAFSGKMLEGDYLLKVSVRDTGIGLSRESMDKLFTSFQRFDLQRNQSVEGTGLGLSICKQLSELMGGTVYAESEYGKGSMFCCEIPQKIGSEVPVGKVELISSAERNMLFSYKKYIAPEARVLVVDDIEMNLLVFASLLKEHRLQIDKADSGKRCLELIREKQYDVIFMDHMMPGMDGMETLERMSQMEHKNQTTPVIMLTANAISGEKEKYLKAGFDGYLTKPIKSEKLEEMLLKYLPEDKVIREETGVDSAADEVAEGKTTVRELSEGSSLIDRKLGLKYTGKDVYEEILGSYVKVGHKKLPLIRELCRRETWKDYVTEVHALKSTSLSIGAEGLSEAAAELEKAGKAGEYELIREKNEDLLMLYGEVLAACEGMLYRPADKREAMETIPPVSDRKVLSEELLTNYALRMEKAVRSFDNDEIVVICNELAGYSYRGVDLGERFAAVREAAEDFECEKAGETAKQIFEELR